MGNFDIAISLDETTLNRIVSTLFERPSLRKSLFSGTQVVSVLGTQVTVGWDVEQSPTAALSPPSAEAWNIAIKQDGSRPQPTQNAFVVTFSQFTVSKEASNAGVETANTAVQAICVVTVDPSSNQLTLDPIAVVVDLSKASDIDKVIYRNLLIPQILQTAKTMLSNQQIPAITFQGVQFGQSAFVVGNGRLIAIANLSGKPIPTLPDESSLPSGPFYILMSREVMERIAQSGMQGLQGKSASTSGSQNFGVGNANYSASISLDRVTGTLSSENPAIFNASLGISASASAGVDVFSVIGDEIVDGIKTVGNAIADAFSSY